MTLPDIKSQLKFVITLFPDMCVKFLQCFNDRKLKIFLNL